MPPACRPPCAARHAAAVRQAVARDRRCARRRILRRRAPDAARQLHAAVPCGAARRHARQGAAARAAVPARGAGRAAWRLIVADGQAQIVLTQTGAPYPAFAYRTFWLILLGVACWLIGRRIPLQRIDFACPARPAQRLSPVLRRARAFRPARQPARVQRRIPRAADDPLRAGAEDLPARRAGNLLVRYRHDTGWVAKTRAQLKALPAAEWPDFDTLAVRLGTTPATLRRRLRSEGQSFAAIKDELRGALAQSLLRGHALGVAEIAAGSASPSRARFIAHSGNGRARLGAFRRDVHAAEGSRGSRTDDAAGIRQHRMPGRHGNAHATPCSGRENSLHPA